MFDFDRLEHCTAAPALNSASAEGRRRDSEGASKGPEQGGSTDPSVSLELRENGRHYAVMPDGVGIRYELLGERGPCVVLIPGGQCGVCDGKMSQAQFPLLRQKLPRCGYRVLLHDRRNTGSSDVGYEAGCVEAELQARDLRLLLQRLQLEPAVLVGNSSGGRLSLLLARWWPETVSTLVLMNLTGGAIAAKVLGTEYYRQYMAAAEEQGMSAVVRMGHYAELRRHNPRTEARLLAIPPADFAEAMRTSAKWLEQSADFPVVGHSASDLAQVQQPTLVVFSMHRANCKMHTLEASQNLRAALPCAEAEVAEWSTREEIAAGVLEFLQR